MNICNLKNNFENKNKNWNLICFIFPLNQNSYTIKSSPIKKMVHKDQNFQLFKQSLFMGIEKLLIKIAKFEQIQEFDQLQTLD